MFSINKTVFKIVAKPLSNVPQKSLIWNYCYILGSFSTKCSLTLSSHKHQGHICCVAVVGHTAVVMINSLKADLILQTKDENHCVHPQRKLRKSY